MTEAADGQLTARAIGTAAAAAVADELSRNSGERAHFRVKNFLADDHVGVVTAGADADVRFRIARWCSRSEVVPQTGTKLCYRCWRRGIPTGRLRRGCSGFYTPVLVVRG